MFLPYHSVIPTCRWYYQYEWPTLSRKIHHLFVCSFTIKEFHGVFAFVLRSWLIDLQPDLLPCDTSLHSVCKPNLGVTEKYKTMSPLRFYWNINRICSCWVTQNITVTKWFPRCNGMPSYFEAFEAKSLLNCRPKGQTCYDSLLLFNFQLSSKFAERLWTWVIEILYRFKTQMSDR